MAGKTIVPNSRPKIGLMEILQRIQGYGLTEECALVGLRGYYRDTMGKPGENDRGIYDDMIAFYAPDRFQTFNANCDPGAFREGIASLCAGRWWYKIGIHGLTKPKARQYKALVQADMVEIRRDGEVHREKGFYGINIHRGGYNSVSSLGCQTIYPSQWPEFIELVETKMREHKQPRIAYVLEEVS